MNRADRMLAALADGEPHSRHEIFAHAGCFFLTNNAAAELRARGIVVEQTRDADEFFYRLLSLDERSPRGQGRLISDAGDDPALRSSSEGDSSTRPVSTAPSSLEPSGASVTAERLGPDGCADAPEQLSFEVAA